jgi:hypothetical protein
MEGFNGKPTTLISLCDCVSHFCLSMLFQLSNLLVACYKLETGLPSLVH